MRTEDEIKAELELNVEVKHNLRSRMASLKKMLMELDTELIGVKLRMDSLYDELNKINALRKLEP